MCFSPRIYNANKTTKKCIQFLNTIFYIKNSPRTWMFIDKSTIYFTNGNGKQFYWKTFCPGAWVRSKNLFHLNCWTTYPRSCTTFEFLVPIEQTRHKTTDKEVKYFLLYPRPVFFFPNILLIYMYLSKWKK